MKRRTVTLCMIARNEEASIGQAIKSVMALVDEIIVVDTGSRDNTRIIAEGYGARVIDFPWQDDFSAARNAGLAEAMGEWILVLDADERLQPVRPVNLQRLLAASKVAGYRFQHLDAAGERPAVEPQQVRLFRAHPDIRYRYPIHEQIQPALMEWAADKGMAIADSDLTVLNKAGEQLGGAERRDRNLRILRRAVKDHPDEPYFEYHMARETLLTLDEEVLPIAGLREALLNLERSWQKALALPEAARRQLTYGVDLLAKVAACHTARGHFVQAAAVAKDGRRDYGSCPVLQVQEIAAMTHFLKAGARNLPQIETARLLKRVRRDIHTLRSGRSTEQVNSVEKRICGLYPLRYLGELALLEGQIAKAAELFEKALTSDESYSFAWLGLADCARFAGDRKRALQLYLRTVTENEWNHQAWLRGSSLLEELGFHDNAASWRRKVMVLFPEHPQLDSLGSEETAVPTPHLSVAG